MKRDGTYALLLKISCELKKEIFRRNFCTMNNTSRATKDTVICGQSRPPLTMIHREQVNSGEFLQSSFSTEVAILSIVDALGFHVRFLILGLFFTYFFIVFFSWLHALRINPYKRMLLLKLSSKPLPFITK